jgi:biopolymer transport protein ExbD
MSLKKKTKVSTEFSMASMTDIIFLLLLYFMIISTVVQTNAIKVLLPQSTKTKTTEKTIVRVTIDPEYNFYIAQDKAEDAQVNFEDIEPFLQQVVSENPEMYVALYADETVPYREIVRVLDVANRNNFRLVLATRPLNP